MCTYERVRSDHDQTMQDSVLADMPIPDPIGSPRNPAPSRSVANRQREDQSNRSIEGSSTVNSGGTIQSSRTSPRDDRPEPFMGQNSIPHFVRDQTSAEDTTIRRNNVEGGLMPILGLEGSLSGYPFMPIANDINSMHGDLPSDRDIIK